jgi:hypothetical protein
MTDTSREAVEFWAAIYADIGPRDDDHIAALRRTLLAERDAAYERGAADMRERAAAVAAGVEAHQETEAYAARLRCDSVADNECRIGSTAAGLIAAAIRALPAPPSNSAEAAQAEAWRVLLAWAADAPPRYRQALATLLEMLAHATPNSRSAAAIKAGAARLNAVTTKEALE